MSDHEVLIMAKRLAQAWGVDEVDTREALERAIVRGTLRDLDFLGISKADLASIELLDVDRDRAQRRDVILAAADAVVRRRGGAA